MTRTLLLFLFGLFLLPQIGQTQLEQGMRSYEVEAGASLVFADQTFISALAVPEPGWMTTEHLFLSAGGGLGLLSGPGNTFLLAYFRPEARIYFNPRSANNHFYLGLDADLTILVGEEDGRGVAFPHIGVTRFIQPDLSLRGQLGIEADSDLEEATIAFIVSMESFLRRDDWKARKSSTYPFRQGSILLGDPSAALRFFAEGGTQINLDVGFGYFFSDKFAAGMDVNLNDVSGLGRETTFTPYARYYLSQNRSSWFLNLEGGPIFTSVDFGGGNVTDTNAQLFVGAGFNQFLSPRVAIETKIGLQTVFGQDVSALACTVGMQYMLE